MKKAKKGRIRQNAFKKIRLIVSDFDGVFTDNRVLVSEDGVESVLCSRSDSLGIELLKAKGKDILVISKEKNKVVEARCRKLNLQVFSGINSKLDMFKKIIGESGLPYESVCYIGNDINDLECIVFAHVGVAVADAYPEVIAVADFVTSKHGGNGAIREIIDLVLKA